ncbi:MAG TPA: AAA family ATPase [Gemmatimonadaceae bacterium]|jgi:twinkle protein
MSDVLRVVLSRVKKARSSGSGYVGLCPAHEDKQPSLSISVGTTGNILLNCHAGCTFEAIVDALGIDRRELTVSRNDESARPELIATYVYRNSDGSVFARKGRYVDDVGAKTFRWWRPDPNDEGKWIPGGNNAPLYRLPELIAAPTTEIVVIVEGEKDADRLASLEYITTTTPGGAGARWRDDDTVYFKGRRVCIVADDDEPGRKKAKETREALIGVAAAVGIVTMPNPNRIKGFDASDFLDSGGTQDHLRAIVERFDEPQLPPEVVRYEILTERVLELWAKGGDEPGVYPGWRSLAKHYRPKTGQLTIVTGAPNAGKSTWLDDLIIRTSCADEDDSGESRARWRWIVFSAEQFPPERHAALLLQKLFAKPFTFGRSARISETDVRVGMGTLREYVTLLDPSFGHTSLDRILDVAAEVNARRSHDALLIDPYNVLAATSRAKNETEHEFINTALTRLRTFGQSERMHVVVVAHPTKLRRENDESEYPQVRPWDISGSAHWFNHADAIVAMWRAMHDDTKAKTGEVELSISKIRFQPECGQLGVVKLYFDKITTRYLEHPVVRSESSNRSGTQHSMKLAPWEEADVPATAKEGSA